MLRKNLEISYIFVFALFLAVVSLFFLKVINPDTFWHIKVGEYIVQNMSIPRTDIYSWSVYGEPWTVHQWFADVIIYFFYAAFGLYGLWIMVFLCCFTTGLLIYKGLLVKNVPSLLASIVSGSAVFFLLGWFSPWPQAFVFVGYAAYIYLSLNNEWNIRTYVYVALISIYWANIHSSAVMFPLLLLVESAWYSVLKREPLEKTRQRLVAAFVSVVCTLLNPHGINLWRYAVGEGLFLSTYRSYIAEWRPYDFSNIWFVFVFLVCSIAIYYTLRKDHEHIKLELMRALGFWFLTLLSRIYMPYAVLSTFILFGFFNSQTSRKVSRILVIFLFLLCIGIGILNPLPNDLKRISEQEYPVQAAEFVSENQHEKIFNMHEWGGYLLFNGIAVYMDGRNDIYRDIIGDYMKIRTGQKPVMSSIKDTGAETVLIKSLSPIDLIISDSGVWKEVYRDDVAVIYLITH